MILFFGEVRNCIELLNIDNDHSKVWDENNYTFSSSNELQLL